MNFKLLLLLGINFASDLLEAKPIKLVTTIPDLAWVAQEIAGSEVEAKSLLSGRENPHDVDAVPEFIRLAADADIVCMVGLELEVGYMPAVLAKTGNAAVQTGGIGYCEAGKAVSVLEKPSGVVDRSMGDVHPAGNPHFYLSPRALAEAAGEIAAAIQRVKPALSNVFSAGLASLRLKLQQLSQAQKTKLASVTGLQSKSPDKAMIMEYHREFAYFFAEYDLQSFGSLEEKPGVPPSAGRLAQVALAAKAAGVRLVLATDYAPVKTLERFTELSGIPVLRVPTMLQGDKIKTYPELQEFIVTQIVAKLSTPPPPAKS